MAKETTIARESKVNPINAVSQRTLSYSTDGSTAMGIINRAAVIDSVYGDTRNRNYRRNRQRIQRAVRNLFDTINP